MTGPDGHTQTLKQEQPIRTANHGNALDIGTVVRDYEGNTWIGTLGKGLFRVRSSAGDSLPEQFSRVDGLSNDNVRSSFEDREHNLWVGTQDGLDCIRDGGVTTLNRREGIASDNVDALAAGRDGIVWASTSIGIDRLDSGHPELYLKGTAGKALFTDREDTLWAGTGGGGVRMTNGIWSPVRFPSGLSLNNVVAIAPDEQHRIWLSDADKGLYRWSSQKTDDFSKEPLLQGKSILTIREDSKGRVWFGFYEGGVAVFEEGVFRSYSERDGLASGSINAISVDDNGPVWIGAERGLTRFDGARFVTLNSTRGLPGERVFWIIPAHDDRSGSDTPPASLASTGRSSIGLFTIRHTWLRMNSLTMGMA